jgi:hypothetical protein
VQQEKRESLVLLVPPGLQGKLEQQGARALLVRVALLAKQELRANQGAQEDPVKRVLLGQLALLEKLVLRAILDPQVKLVRRAILDLQDPREPRD